MEITLSRGWATVLGVYLVTAPGVGLPDSDLTGMAFEDLLNVEVTSVAKKAQSISDAAAAVYVISNEDLRRSGATSIPDALRMVPGVQVARTDGNKWAVSARGFNGRFANKLLVLIDGRAVYTLGFSGVFWEHNDVVLEDVERIEVIRGPGATLWGANAVNGVINIITKTADETLGGLAVVSAGTEERAGGVLRYGGKVAEGATARAFLKYAERDQLATAAADDAGDGWDITHGGFRLDARSSAGDLFTLQGDVYGSGLDQRLALPDTSVPDYRTRVDDQADASGWNLLGRWERALSLSSDLSVQAYFDHFEREEIWVGQSYDTWDLELQHRIRFAQRHDVLWGLGYRYISTGADNSRYVSLAPLERQMNLWSGFVQDDIALVEDKLHLTVGSKFEHNAYTGFEVQPNVRLLWNLDPNHVLWGAVSRAVRTPSRIERDGTIWATVLPPPAPFLPPAAVVATANRDYGSEELLAYELGYRLRPSRRLSLDLALFYNDYDRLRTSEAKPPVIGGDPMVVVPLRFDNKAEGTSYGLELAADWRVSDQWRLALAYSYLQVDLDIAADSTDTTNGPLETSSPEHQLSLRSSLDLGHDLDLDLWLRYVDSVTASFQGSSSDAVPTADAYWNLDVRLAWRPVPDLEWSLVGQNLLNDSHQEGFQELFGSDHIEVQRGVYTSLRWDF